MGRWLLILGVCSACSDPALSIDAPPPPDGYDTARCLVEGDYDTIERAPATLGPNTTLTITLDAGPPSDTLVITLRTSTPGTYFPISQRPCSTAVCVDLMADIGSDGMPAKVYVAGTGMVTWDNVSVSWFGTAESLLFYELDGNTNTFVPDGCKTLIDKVSFSTHY
jgi:hypothetical protein